MEELLVIRLHSYILQNNPELLLSLEAVPVIHDYLEQKVATVGPLMDRLIEEEVAPYYIMEECMDILTHDLRPSKYHYLCRILCEEHAGDYRRLQQAGLLVYEVSNIIAHTIGLFEDYGFTEAKEDDPELATAIREAIANYLLQS